MKIVALADLHGHFPEDVPNCDVVAVAGDIALFDHTLSDYDQGRSLVAQYKAFRAWLNALNMRGIIVVGVAGNHDFAMQEVPGFPEKFNWHYLLDSHTQIDDVIFAGSPWQPWMGGWAFNSPEQDLIDDTEPWLEQKFSLISDHADVVITHSPPAGFGDVVKGVHRGSFALSRAIERVQPTLHVFGHIHKPSVETVDNVTLCNASYVGFDRKPNNHPIQTFEI